MTVTLRGGTYDGCNIQVDSTPDNIGGIYEERKPIGLPRIDGHGTDRYEYEGPGGQLTVLFMTRISASALYVFKGVV